MLAVKENQPVVHEEITEYVEFLDGGKHRELPEDIWESGLEKDHGRIEKRRIRTACDNRIPLRKNRRRGNHDNSQVLH